MVFRRLVAIVAFCLVSAVAFAQENEVVQLDAKLKQQYLPVALEEISLRYGTAEGEDGPTLFVEHHLEELPADYWLGTFGTEKPTADQIFNSLVLTSAWSYQEHGRKLEVLDFMLPGEVSQYILSVRFIEGAVAYIDMES